jgi:hypothetical protein
MEEHFWTNIPVFSMSKYFYLIIINKANRLLYKVKQVNMDDKNIYFIVLFYIFAFNRKWRDFIRIKLSKKSKVK